MALSPGTRLGPHEILSPIGSGGMGEVYKARDTRLDRIVAIKVLLEHLAESLERKARFEREAKAISQLNHPHICTLYDVGEQDGVDYLVMEYIEGETLAEKLKKGALPLDKVLEYGIQIADGLDNAHRAGIVHRDLKPANVMLAKPGVKLLDYGLARVLADATVPVSSEAPTQQKDLTDGQSIIGTLAYMAPEQLEGKPSDARTDIFAFGALLYEMLTGRKAFTGESQASLIAAILEREPPPISSLEPMSPPALEQTVNTCLTKDPEDRWQGAGDLGRQLKIIRGGSQTSEAATVVRMPRRLSLPWMLAFFLVVGVLLGLMVSSLTSPPASTPRPLVRFDVSPPAGTTLQVAINSPDVAVSPDGRRIAYIAGASTERYLYVRELDQIEGTPIVEAPQHFDPFMSPDSEWIGFVDERDFTLK